MNDFRAEAAAATVANLNDVAADQLAAWGESGCVALPGGRRPLHFLTWPHFILSLVCLLLVIGTWPLRWLGKIDRDTVFLILVPGLLLSVSMPTIRALVLRLFLARRPQGFVKAFRDLRPVVVGVEDARTYRKQKMIIEDQGVCLLDPDRRRILLEGCAYRYAIYAKDVSAISPVSGYALERRARALPHEWPIHRVRAHRARQRAPRELPGRF